MRLKGNALKKYMKTVLELETQALMLGNTYDEIEEHINSLGKRRSVSKPVLETRPEISVGGAFAIPLFIIVGALFFGWIVDDLLGWIFDGAFASIFVIGLVIAIVVFLMQVSANSSIVAANKESEIRYHEACCEYKQKIKNDEIRVRAEKEQIPIYAEQLDYIAEAFNDTMEVLEMLYDKGVVYEKYQFDIVAIAMFCEYLEAGRCNDLGSAYNIYETEVRLNLIVTKLDEIIERLDQISQAQWMIYEALNKIERQQEELVSSMHTIAKNQDKIIRNQEEQIESCRAIEYNTDILRRNSEIAMIYQLY